MTTDHWPGTLACIKGEKWAWDLQTSWRLLQSPWQFIGSDGSKVSYRLSKIHKCLSPLDLTNSLVLNREFLEFFPSESHRTSVQQSSFPRVIKVDFTFVSKTSPIIFPRNHFWVMGCSLRKLQKFSKVHLMPPIDNPLRIETIEQRTSHFPTSALEPVSQNSKDFL